MLNNIIKIKEAPMSEVRLHSLQNIMRKTPLLPNQIYHVYNRGVEKRDIFMDTQDFVRFIHCLFALNDQRSIKNFGRAQMSEARLHSFEKTGPRKLLVEIMAFCLMPNHFHLMLRQKSDGGIMKFMHKIGTAHTKYFNQKYNRVGPLCQGRYKAVLVEKDAHFMYLPHYIHKNPLTLLRTTNESSRASLIEKMMFLERYRWSSFSDYIGKKNFPSVTQRSFLLKTFGGTEAYKKHLKEFLKTDDENEGCAGQQVK